MEFENLQDIVDFAIEKEIEAAEFYETAFEGETFSGDNHASAIITRGNPRPQ